MMKASVAVFIALCTSGAFAQHPVIQSVVDGVEIDSLVWSLERLSGEQPVDVGAGSQLIISRNDVNSGNALAADWLQQRLAANGYAPTVQVFSGGVGENVLAEKIGAVHPGRKVVICGHYDAMPAGPVAAPAADDDGTGTVAVLEAARLFAPLQFENTIVFALWDREEQGKVGSAFYAGAAASNDDTLIAVVNIDMVGYDGDGDDRMRIHTKSIANSIALKDTAVTANTLYGIDLLIAINNPGATYSDHASFWSEGYSAILMIEDFDNDANPNYHMPTDLLTHIDLPYFEQVVQLSLATAGIMAVPFDDGTSVVPAIATAHPPRAFPVPASSSVTVLVEAPGSFPVELKVQDMLGRFVSTPIQGDGGSGTRAFHIDLSALPPGTYRAVAFRGDVVCGSVPIVRVP